MLFVVLLLGRSSAVRLADGTVHGIRHGIGVHDDVSLGVSGCSSDRLDQGCLRSQEAFLVGVQDRHQRDLRNVQSFSKKVDPDQDVKHIQAHVADDLRALQGVDVRMQVLHTDPCVLEVFGQILRHPLGQCGDQDLVALRGLFIDLTDQVIHLPRHGANVDRRIQKSGRTDDLLRAKKLMLLFIGTGGCGNEHDLVDLVLELFKLKRPVVLRAGKPEAVIHKGRLAGLVSVIHGAKLRQCHMGLIYDDQEFIREIIQQCLGRRPRRPAVHMPRVILDAGAEAGLSEHLNVIVGALRDPLRFKQLVLCAEAFHLFLQLLADPLNRFLHLPVGRDIMRRWEHADKGQGALRLSCQRIDLRDPVDLISEELHPVGKVVGVRRKDVQDIPSDPEGGSVKINVAPVIVKVDQLLQDLIAVPLFPYPQIQGHLFEINRAAQSVDTGDGADYDNVISPHKGCRSGQTQLVDLIIDRRVLLDIGVSLGHIGLRLVVIIVGNKILYRILREKFLEFSVELRGKRLVMRDDESRLLQVLYDVGHGKCLARTGNAEQRLCLVALPESLRQSLDCLRLIAGGLIFRMKLEFHISSCRS